MQQTRLVEMYVVHCRTEVGVIVCGLNCVSFIAGVLTAVLTDVSACLTVTKYFIACLALFMVDLPLLQEMCVVQCGVLFAHALQPTRGL
jgi:hypothetical protein